MKALEGPLWRALLVFRIAALGYAAVLMVGNFRHYHWPLGGWLILSVMAAWTVVSSLAYARPERRDWPLLTADLAVTAGCLLSTRWIVQPDGLGVGAPTLPMAWVASPVVAWAISGGRRRGAIAALLMSGADVVVRNGFSQATVNGPVLMVLAGVGIGHIARLAIDAEARLQRAVELEAATRERERLARGIHDSVLQVLALLQRRGAELGGEAAELGRLAGEQEATLRTLVTSSGPTPSSARRHPSQAAAPAPGRRTFRLPASLSRTPASGAATSTPRTAPGTSPSHGTLPSPGTSSPHSATPSHGATPSHSASQAHGAAGEEHQSEQAGAASPPHSTAPSHSTTDEERPGEQAGAVSPAHSASPTHGTSSPHSAPQAHGAAGEEHRIEQVGAVSPAPSGSPSGSVTPRSTATGGGPPDDADSSTGISTSADPDGDAALDGSTDDGGGGAAHGGSVDGAGGGAARGWALFGSGRRRSRDGSPTGGASRRGSARWGLSREEMSDGASPHEASARGHSARGDAAHGAAARGDSTRGIAAHRDSARGDSARGNSAGGASSRWGLSRWGLSRWGLSRWGLSQWGLWRGESSRRESRWSTRGDSARGAYVQGDEQLDLVDLRSLLGHHSVTGVSVAAPATEVLLPAPVAAEVAAAVAAAVDNVRLHAGPGAKAWLLVEELDDTVTVTVRDNGRGIPEGRLTEAEQAGRLGLAQSIRGRIRDLGGTTTITSSPTTGTEIELHIPR